METKENIRKAEDETSEWKYLFRQMFIASGTWTVYFSMGLFLGAPTVIIPQLRKDNATIITDETASWISSTLCYSAIPWVFVVPNLARYLGRKKTSICMSIFTIISFINFYYSTTVLQIIISEIFIGFTHACTMTITIIVISEYSSPKNRGLFLTIKSASTYWGIWVSNTIGTFLDWKYIPALGLLCSIFSLTSFLWPESPFWLASRGKFDQCRKAHNWLKGKSLKSQEELEILIKSQQKSYERSFELKCVFRKEFYMPLLLCIIATCQYHFSGKFVITMYAIEIIKKIMNNDRKAFQCMLILDGITICSCYVGCFLSKLLKRRTLLLASSACAVLILFSTSTYLYLIKLSLITENQYLSIILLSSFSISISVGPMILVTSLFGELIALRFKTVSAVIIGFIFFSLHGSLLKFAPKLFKALGLHGAFFSYGIMSLCCIVLLYIYLPETKDRTLSEIEEYFKEKKTVDEVQTLVKTPEYIKINK